MFHKSYSIPQHLHLTHEQIKTLSYRLSQIAAVHVHC